MKKKYYSILIIFLASIIVMIPAMKEEYYKGHDTFFHVANINALKEQISIKNPIPKEPLKYIANNFGYGTRLFYPPVPHLIAAYLSKIWNNVKIGMRLTEWLTFFLSGITFYLLSKKIFKNKKLAILGSIFYMTTPYHITEVFIRDAFSEMFIPIAIPLIILGLLELLNKNYKKFLVTFILGYTLAIYSHLAMSIYFTFILLVSFLPIYRKEILNKKNIKYLMIASVLILIFTSPFWLTLLEIKQSTIYAIFMPYYITGKGDLRFSAINPLLYFDFTLPHTYDFIRYHLHLTVTILLGISVYKIMKRKLWKDKVILFLSLFTCLSIIMTTKLWPWYYTPDILQTLQFPWRLCLYVAFGAILLALIPLKKIEEKKYFNKCLTSLIIIALVGSLYYTYHVDNDKVEINNINYNLGMGNQEEYLPEKVIKNYDYYKKRKNEVITSNKQDNINIIKNEVPNLTFEKEKEEETTIELPRLYYIGYSLKKENQKIPLIESKNGFLEATIKESGIYELTYEGTLSYKISKIICSITIVLILFYNIIYKRKKNKQDKIIN